MIYITLNAMRWPCAENHFANRFQGVCTKLWSPTKKNWSFRGNDEDGDNSYGEPQIAMGCTSEAVPLGANFLRKPERGPILPMLGSEPFFGIC